VPSKGRPPRFAKLRGARPGSSSIASQPRFVCWRFSELRIDVAMKLLGIPLRKPGPFELTGACAMAVGLWFAALGLMHAEKMALDASDAGGLLLVIVWACVSTRLGIRVDRGGRHVAANFLVSGFLIAGYRAALAVVA
jgi:hypothetical protein